VNLYIESSAILSWLFGESTASEVISIIDKSEKIFTSVLSIVEVKRAIIRAEDQKLINISEKHKLLNLFETIKDEWLLFEITKEIRDLASEKFPLEPVRSLDAIHLATVIKGLHISNDLKLLSFDDRIIKNANLLGITLANT